MLTPPFLVEQGWGLQSQLSAPTLVPFLDTVCLRFSGISVSVSPFWGSSQHPPEHASLLAAVRECHYLNSGREGQAHIVPDALCLRVAGLPSACFSGG